MTKYLYGAAVQGIQSFIFQTNQLKEIVGASELVEKVCTELFAEQLGKRWVDLDNDPNAILNAAGNIKYIFEDKELCEKVFRNFPKAVMETAPGVTISQAVVEIEEDFGAAVDDLEKRLRAKRNQPSQSITIGNMGIQRSRKTGLPSVCKETDKNKVEYLDSSSYNKRKANHGSSLYKKAVDAKLREEFERVQDIGDMTLRNDWIAIIHADGNGLGQVVRKIGKKPQKFREFSKKLDAATVCSARHAIDTLADKEMKCKKGNTYLPIRPVILGGDDLTVIIRGDLAVEFTKTYMEEFEKQTKALLSTIDPSLSEGLTACAGIAFIKSSFPYYYGYNLAEELCSAAKKDAKEFKKEGISCLMFHKVQDSFVESYDDISSRELSAGKGISFKFGPYYLESNVPKDRWTVSMLEKAVDELDNEDGNVVKSGIRQWLGVLTDSHDTAKGLQKIERMKDIAGSRQKTLIDTLTKGIGRQNTLTFPAYDVLSLHSIMFQKTK